jgi:hypothetical protein
MVSYGVTNYGQGLDAAGGVENMLRFSLSDSAAYSGTVWCNYLTPDVTFTATKITMVTGGTGSSGLTLARMGIYSAATDGSLTLMAQTASDTTLFASTWSDNVRSLVASGSLPASVQMLAGRRYALAYIQVGTTPGRVAGASINNQTGNPVISRGIDGNADLPATIAVAGMYVNGFSSYSNARP